ncbi:MAG: putative ribosome biogenesis GTPase RsgA [Pelotomaculum sp. PtaB.Bin013]|uniref:Small ribosomal subunit biogenesis GTPase RsgA n=1 Tax=Pelotomaculum isophthalicicum JI TaxID=947010 RepID=A0A9X4GYU8_9FIRM|nr:ribosome small subunit-dependent GTPase A [Pelotomaculum isophthalicicum]MDF9408150.1 ribosome small subunit-dependent GTPase A [Pelotomaculum isophthalicicum JI]OPX82498.1 MAG: putative ribosome biogenesis GTPase RsgA [Pelotomaculum sp. PtaB.Bin013]
MNSGQNLVQGIVRKAYSGYYYVYDGHCEWECSLRGRFRYEKQQVLVGDRVELAPTQDRVGVIVKILPRRSALFRPPIANVDQAIIIFSVRQPEPNPGLLDRFLITAIMNQIDPLICFNKIDLIKDYEFDLVSRYQGIYPVVVTSAVTGAGLDRLRGKLRGKVSVFAGPSGVGKSTILNAIMPELTLKTGAISEKLKRGKHTTRHVELIPLPEDGLVADTPGFSNLDLPDIKLEELARYFPEMEEYSGNCHFGGCLHDKEPGCAVKEAVELGGIEESRYRQYVEFLQELRGRRRY